MKPVRRIVHGHGQRKYAPEGPVEHMPTSSHRGARKEFTADELQVSCWCGKHYVTVPAIDVSRGLTRSCRYLDCEPPK